MKACTGIIITIAVIFIAMMTVYTLGHKYGFFRVSVITGVIFAIICWPMSFLYGKEEYRDIKKRTILSLRKIEQTGKETRSRIKRIHLFINKTCVYTRAFFARLFRSLLMSIIVGIGTVGFTFLLLTQCDGCFHSHQGDYEEYDYIDDGHRPDRF